MTRSLRVRVLTLYGSRKPGNEAYELKYMFKAVKSETTDDVNIEQVNISTLQLDDYFTKISVRNKEGLIDTFQIKPDKIPEYNEIRDNNTKKRKLNPILKKAIIHLISTTNQLTTKRQ